MLHEKILGHGNQAITQIAEFLEGLKNQVLKTKTTEEIKQLRKQRKQQREEHKEEHQHKNEQEAKSNPVDTAKTEEAPQPSKKQNTSDKTQQEEGTGGTE